MIYLYDLSALQVKMSGDPPPIGNVAAGYGSGMWIESGALESERSVGEQYLCNYQSLKMFGRPPLYAVPNHHHYTPSTDWNPNSYGHGSDSVRRYMSSSTPTR